MHQNWITIGALSGFLGVALGAFGAHGLKEIATPEQLAWWSTGVSYHLWHALALILLGVLQQQRKGGDAAGWMFAMGTAIFSGTLYAMALGAPRWFGAITPLGGLLFLGAWLRLAWFGR